MSDPAPNTDQDVAIKDEATYTYNGYTIHVNGQDKGTITDVSGNQVVDPTARAEAFTQMWPGLEKILQSAAQTSPLIAAKIATMSGAGQSSFAANDNNVEAIQIGYITKVSEKLPFPVRLLGITEEDDQKTYHYTARINFGSWGSNEKAINKLNKEGKYKNAGFGEAGFPTDKFKSKTNELGMLYDNKKTLSITDDWIHGESFSDIHAHCLDCDWGEQYYCKKDNDDKNNDAAAFPVWRVNHLVI